MEVEIANDDELTGQSFKIQLKATDHAQYRKDGLLSYSTDKAHLERWLYLSHSSPVLFIVYDASRKKAFYLDIGRWIRERTMAQGGDDWIKKQNHHTLLLSPKQDIESSIPSIEEIVARHHSELRRFFRQNSGYLESANEGDGGKFLRLPIRGSPIERKAFRWHLRDQGSRATVVAFAVLGAVELSLRKQNSFRGKLSPEHLYYQCKHADKMFNVEGTFVRIALQVMKKNGVCLESEWPYSPLPVPIGPPPRALTSAVRISDYFVLKPDDIHLALAVLDRGIPLVCGVYTFPNWDFSSVALTGAIPMPLPGAKPDGGHALCLVGYRLTVGSPGGGTFIFRNSWGPSWGRKNPDGRGMGHLPFDYLRQFGMDLFAIDGVIVLRQ